MLDKLSKQDRMLLLKFVCAFAWADLEVRDQERAFVARLMDKLELDDDERQQVQSWLDVSPSPEDVDPNKIPRAHRQVFIDAARAMIYSDGEVDEEERENLELLKQLLDPD